MSINKKTYAKIAIFFTGGTVGMRRTQDGAISPGIQVTDMLTELPKEDVALLTEGFCKKRPGSPISETSISIQDIITHHILPVEWAELPSPHMTPSLMFSLAQDVRAMLQHDHIIGAVVVHGTDVMEETAFMLDLVLDTDKPVVVTGGMRAYGEAGYDGLHNISAAIRVCLSTLPKNLGVMVLMSDKIFAAREAMKIHSMSLDSFAAPSLGPIGTCVAGGVQIYRTPIPHVPLCPKYLEPAVELITLAPGMDGRFIACARKSGARGIVVEGFGAGNVPPSALEEIILCLQAHIPVVLTSRCPAGGVWPVYGYYGGGKHLQNLGVILGGGLRGSKARILLMVALSIAQYGTMPVCNQCVQQCIEESVTLRNTPSNNTYKEDVAILKKFVATQTPIQDVSPMQAARLIFAYFPQ